MKDEKQVQLEALLETCRHLDAKIRYQPKYGHFIVMVQECGADSASERMAHNIQETILQKAAMYDRLVCYCFDPFSTMVYAV